MPHECSRIIWKLFRTTAPDSADWICHWYFQPDCNLLFFRFPASIKNGIARSGNESTPVIDFCAIIIRGISEK